MSFIRVTKEFSFEMAHALWNYNGPCRNIHGHSYILYVTVAGKPLNIAGHSENGMVIDFSELKKIVKKNVIDKFDHALVINKDSSTKFTDTVEQMFEKYYMVDFQPTCENLINYMATVIKDHLPDTVSLFSLRLCETATSYAEWYASDNQN